MAKLGITYLDISSANGSACGDQGNVSSFLDIYDNRPALLRGL
jgi:hypothetical protein